MHREGELEKALKRIYRPGGAKLTVLGSATEALSYKEREIIEKIFVVRGLQVVLLSRPASVSLKLVARVDTINQESVRQTYPKLCDGLGWFRSLIQSNLILTHSHSPLKCHAESHYCSWKK